MTTDLNERMREIQASLKKDLKLDIKFADEMPVYDRVKTGMPMFDYVLGGGFPRGGITLIHGEASTGKTFVTQRAIANAQKQGLTCAFIDVEHAYDPKWANTIGIDNSNIMLFQPLSAEDALEVAERLCAEETDIVVLDSIAALLPAAEAEGDMADMQVGAQARLINKFFRKVVPSLTTTALIVINQRRVNVGGRSMNGIAPIALPAGKAQEYFTKIIVETRRGDRIYPGSKRTGEPLGFTLFARAVKNKTCPPFRECKIPIYYTGEIDIVGEIFDLGIMYGIIERGGPYYSYKDTKVMGRDKFISAMEEQGLTKAIEQDVELHVTGEVSVDG